MTRVSRWVKSVNQGGPRVARPRCARCPAGRRQPWAASHNNAKGEHAGDKTQIHPGRGAGAAALSLPLTGRAGGGRAGRALRRLGVAGHYPAWLAIQAGYFKAEGLDVGWESFGTTSARVSALLSGNIDMAVTAAPAALAVMARGRSTSPSSACRRISAAWKG